MKIRLNKETPPRVENVAGQRWWRYDITNDEGGVLLSGWVQGNKSTAQRKAVAMKKRIESRNTGASPVRMASCGPGKNKLIAEDLL